MAAFLHGIILYAECLHIHNTTSSCDIEFS